MVLKDWKIKSKGEEQILWVNIKTNHHIEILKFYDEGWYFIRNWINNSSKKFKTKSQALNYAYKYMRTH